METMESDQNQETQRRTAFCRYEFNFAMEGDDFFSIMNNYSRENIYNADETAIFYRMLPR